MGASQSYLTPEAALTAVVLAGAIGVGYTQFSQTEAVQRPASTPPPAQSKKSKKKKKQGVEQADVPASDDGAVSSISQAQNQKAEVHVVPFPDVIPGQFDASSAAADDPQDVMPASKPKKAKKKKSKAAAGAAKPSPADAVSDSGSSVKPSKQGEQAPSSASSSKLSRPLQQSTTSIDTDGSWTRVEPRRRQAGEEKTAPAAESTDAGITSSVTGNSSPLTERTEDESFSLSPNVRDSGEHRRTLAERVLPKPRKTGVDDMLETSDYPTIARVMRVQPLPEEKPAEGFSWGDYEDVKVGDAGGNDADGEDDGWGVVPTKSKRKERPSQPSQQQQQSAPDALTQRQRQNSKKREAEKEAKAAFAAEQLAKQAKQRAGAERARMLEQQQKKGGSKVSGGMKATVENGKLVWE